MPRRVLAFDIGSTGCKTCLYEIAGKLDLLGAATSGYAFTTLNNGGVEQNPDDWWTAMGDTVREIQDDLGGSLGRIDGISFCAQMQGLVLIDQNLQALRPAMSYMDQRGGEQRDRVLGKGLKIEGMNALKLLKSLAINGAVSASVKDPVWKYLWVRDHEPDLFAKVHKWLDVKDYLIARATGQCTMTRDSAFATFMTEKSTSHRTWSRRLLAMHGVDPAHMPTILHSTDQAGLLKKDAAEDLGLEEGIPVFGGGGDASLITIGAGAVEVGDAYIYTGTSGWAAMTVDKPKVDISTRTASIAGAQKDKLVFFGEQETAGKCLEWVKDHMALDEINMYLNAVHVAEDPETRYTSLYDFLVDSISQVPPGSGGVIFTPWLHGNRAPFEDSNARGMFFNLSMDTGKRRMIRAVVEGILFHEKWLLESVDRNFPLHDGSVAFVGGGALSPAIAQILADILERPVRRMADPQNAGAAGAALVAGIGLGEIRAFEDVPHYLDTLELCTPNPTNAPVYRKNYAVFKRLYGANKKLFARLNQNAES